MAVRSRSLVVLTLLLALASCAGRSPETPSAKSQLAFGASMAQRGLWAEALFRFEQAARLEPQNGRAVSNIAVAYEALGKFEEARVAYERAVKLDPGSPDIKRNQARFLEFLQGFKPAAKPAAAPIPPPPTGSSR